MSLIMGIDPGLSGAIAVIHVREDQSVRLLSAADMPLTSVAASRGKKAHKVLDLPAMADLMRTDMFPVANLAVIEKVGAAPGQGVTSMFSFGYAAGAAAGAAAAANIPVEFLRPQLWKRIAGVPAGSDKDYTRLMALAMFPDAKALFKLKKHHGRADAMLIAYAYVCHCAGKKLKVG